MTRKASNKRKKVISGGNSSEISLAAEVIADNLDLLTEILLPLPAKILIRFKSVSKRWLSLISDPQFATNHSTRNPSPPSISGLYFYSKKSFDSKKSVDSASLHLNAVSLHRDQKLPFLAFLDGLGGDSKTMIEHSLKGILLFKHFDETTTSYIVCNPTTLKFTMLSPGWSSKPPHVAYLAFDPSKSPHYKVVLVSLSTSQPYQIDVYSSHNACWKEVLVQDKCCNGRGVFWNGAIHWLTDENVLLRFDIDTEVMIAVSNPPKPKILSLFETLYFGVCGGSLVLIQSCQSFPDGFRILELKKDYSGWCVKYWVDLRPLRSEFPVMDIITYRYEFGFKVLHVLKGEKQNDFSVVVAIPALATGRITGRIILYNPKRRTWDVLPDLFPCELIGDSPFHPFIETLFPL